MAENLTTHASKFLLRELGLNVLLFPIWWYGKGLVRFGNFCTSEVSEFSRLSRWSPLVWYKNIFVPMYSDYSKSGRAISFAVRAVVALALTVVLVAFFLAYFLLFVGYLVFPAAAIYYLAYQIVRLPWLI
jgi:hypothetical protein